MRETVAIEWVKALRSGKYRQGKGRLKDLKPLDYDHLHDRVLSRVPQYCCLGVLCDISPVGYWDESAYCTLNRGDQRFLPPEVMAWAEIKTRDGSAHCGERDVFLTGMNDLGTSFSEIADFIEKNWEKL